MPRLRTFDTLFALAAARKVGADAFERTLPTPMTRISRTLACSIE